MSRESTLRAENCRERRARKLRASVGAAERIRAAQRADRLSRRRAGVSEVIRQRRDALPARCWGGIKKARQSKRRVRVYVKPVEAALQRAARSEDTQVKSRVEPASTSSSCAAPRCAALMASLLGNGSRASGAQSGQVKCKLKRRRRRRSKRKGTTLPRFRTCRPPLSFFVPGRGGAHLGGSSQRYSPRKSRSHAAAPRRLHFANI